MSGTIKIPQITVDEYGHVTKAADETITIKMPSAADLGLSNAMHFLGITTTNITDDRADAVIVINNKGVTAVKGDVVLYNHQEFVWTGTKWELLGDESSYKVKQTPVNSPAVANAGTAAFIDTISQDANGNITATKKKV
jgi:hypothetical protein